jgi:hypothetical protein
VVFRYSLLDFWRAQRMFIEAETVRSAWFGLSRAYLRGITDMLAVSAGCSVDGRRVDAAAGADGEGGRCLARCAG